MTEVNRWEYVGSWKKINNVANLGKWSNDEKVNILKLKLAEIAEELFLSVPTHSHLTEYNDIARILIARFEKAVPLSTRLQLFSSCIQGSSESVQEFAARINKLGTQIFQSGNSTQNTAGRYIKNFAKRALPLTNLLRKDTPFEWTSETQEAFDDIKKAILNPPVLALPDQDAELQITTDASSRGIGAVLEQKYPNSEVKPLYFFQRN
ncbi:transposon Tf2-9 polyprotein [Trichonephila clavipes]|nr:transposon Tf2-9 polyprotein [Trichonephila clavipes]